MIATLVAFGGGHSGSLAVMLAWGSVVGQRAAVRRPAAGGAAPGAAPAAAAGHRTPHRCAR